MTGGYVLADERDVRTVGTLVRRERAAGGVELTRANVQDAAAVGTTTSAPSGLLTEYKTMFDGIGPIGPIQQSLGKGILLPPGKKIAGTVVLAGKIHYVWQTIPFSMGFYASVMMEILKSSSSTVYSQFHYSFFVSRAPGPVADFNLEYATFNGVMPVAGILGFPYDVLLPSGQGAILNDTNEDILIYARVYEPTASAINGFSSLSSAWTYTIF